ncbi:hypothetical protein [Meiothermus granaticius]|uniref:hypothetical protein n=1 Tax=Meiothermus granaticius TaxID=863370 RepID=UPI001649ECE5|nr:hypothetical protein [Meiothermus granaticius]MCL6526239.1 hypothetical protein [Thermaceae bacterium]
MGAESLEAGVNEAAVFLLRLLLWGLPGVVSFLGLRALLEHRVRVGLGLWVAALLLAVWIKPWGLSLLSLALGALLALGPRRKSAGRWLEDQALLRGKNRKP